VCDEMDPHARIAELERELSLARAAVGGAQGGRGVRGGRGRGGGGSGGRGDGEDRGRGRGRGRGQGTFVPYRLCQWGAACRFGDSCTFLHPERGDSSASGVGGSPARGGDARGSRFFAFLKEESTAFAKEEDVLKFVAAATSEEDQAQVISGLGTQGGRGQARLREICMWPAGFRTRVSYAARQRRPLSFQRVVVPGVCILAARDGRICDSACPSIL